ncbi:unnamed protein product [Rotaria sp. Silwood1]|nr:unnamed protein product [Rotaria sp. Silwood1]
MIYLFGSHHSSSINSDQSIENSIRRRHKKYIDTNGTDFLAPVLDLLVVKKIIVDSFRNTGNKWKSLSQLIVDVYFVHLQSYITISSSKGQSLLNISSTQLTLFGIVSSVELQPIDPCVVAFRSLSNRNDIDGPTIN